MTDKEQIIIDGVNIIDCDNYYVEQETDQVKCDLSGEYCRENKNCFYKQLARKTQECEALKSESFTRDSLITLQEEEIEELKRKVELMMDCPDCKVDEYKKALDEIERICLEDVHIFADGTELRYDSLDAILDIINKLKGGNDE